MAKQGQMERIESLGTPHLESFTAVARKAAAGGPSLRDWNPPFCGNLDIRIARDGAWFYLGSPIERPELVRLFSQVLRREGECYFLVTPAEKVGIVVDDVPFMAIEMKSHDDRGEPVLTFRTNVGDVVTCDGEHPLRFSDSAKGGLIPYLHVRADLWAKLTRSLYYELVDRGEVRLIDGDEVFGVASAGMFFAIADAVQMRDCG
jgi:hypothetical protein